jgi:hypothetical protein
MAGVRDRASSTALPPRCEIKCTQRPRLRSLQPRFYPSGMKRFGRSFAALAAAGLTAFLVPVSGAKAEGCSEKCQQNKTNCDGSCDRNKLTCIAACGLPVAPGYEACTRKCNEKIDKCLLQCRASEKACDIQCKLP